MRVNKNKKLELTPMIGVVPSDTLRNFKHSALPTIRLLKVPTNCSYLHRL